MALVDDGSSHSESIREIAIKDGQLSYIWQDCSCIPSEILTKLGDRIKRLDLSHNKIRLLPELQTLINLDEVILDDNEVTEHALGLLPSLPNLRSLTLNKNKIRDIDRAVDALSRCCPNLIYLSLYGNECCPDQLSPTNRDSTREDYDRYRLRVISGLRCLKFLDSRPVSEDERRRAMERSAYLKTVRCVETTSQGDSFDSSSSDSDQFNPLPSIIKSSRPSVTYRSVGSRDQPRKGLSEGNRFITNKHL